MSNLSELADRLERYTHASIGRECDCGYCCTHREATVALREKCRCCEETQLKLDAIIKLQKRGTPPGTIGPN